MELNETGVKSLFEKNTNVSRESVAVPFYRKVALYCFGNYITAKKRTLSSMALSFGSFICALQLGTLVILIIVLCCFIVLSEIGEGRFSCSVIERGTGLVTKLNKLKT